MWEVNDLWLFRSYGFWPILWETHDNLFTNMWRLKGEWQIIIANYTFLGNSHFTYIRILVPRCQNINILLRKLNSKQQYSMLIRIEIKLYFTLYILKSYDFVWTYNTSNSKWSTFSNLLFKISDALLNSKHYKNRILQNTKKTKLIFSWGLELLNTYIQNVSFLYTICFWN